ncbi:uncharacterized protein KY384_005933 [Bacidia gigantensis]|uniref:uncharacterized protein n=1 Tax=Bacidia gigantensis TaxID=2732470 RepID=UPI001D052FFC|nr:uncharacterized protein KY384_005933 [Bacidia gigantensis]KAG8529297.1 hypothetical protein KY384_005933 [Bacidia gigantensis]
MITRLSAIAISASILCIPLAFSLSPSDIPPDTPIASLVSSAKAQLAGGNANDALTYFDVAIARDPKNYLTIFQRALSIRPDFEGALLQRAKIKSRNAEWTAAKEDYQKAKKIDTPEYTALEEASGAAGLAADAEKEGDWENCVGHSGIAILVASTSLRLRQIRARCRLERGEVLEALSDIQHSIKLAPSSISPHMQISAMMFFSINDREKGIEQMKKCMRSDPDSRPCSKMLRREKQMHKALQQVEKLSEKKQYNSAVKLLVKTGEEPGLIDEVKEEVNIAKEAGYIHKNSPNELYNKLIETACEFYSEMSNKKKAAPYCEEALSQNEFSLHGLLHKGKTQLDSEEFESAIDTLNTANEHHPQASQEIQPLLQKAHTLLKRSKTKDYYKVLGVPTDADELAIKRAYRRMTKQHHPDKALIQGVTREEAQKKMASINEAYEVLSDPELRTRFDRGDDPNNPEQQQGGPFHGSPFGQGPGGQQFFFRQGAGGGGGQQFKFQQGGGGFQFPGGF